MASKSGPRVWFEITVAGASFPVKLARECDVAALDGLEGLTSIKTHEIFVNADLPEERQREVAIHEILHLLFAQSGLSRYIDPKGEDAEREEMMIRILSPHLWDSLSRSGLLKLPKARRASGHR